MYERTTYLNSELYNAFEFYVLFAMFYRGRMDWTLPTCVTRWRHSSCCTATKGHRHVLMFLVFVILILTVCTWLMSRIGSFKCQQNYYLLKYLRLSSNGFDMINKSHCSSSSGRDSGNKLNKSFQWGSNIRLVMRYRLHDLDKHTSPN